jgi:hypothetical protein
MFFFMPETLYTGKRPTITPAKNEKESDFEPKIDIIGDFKQEAVESDMETQIDQHVPKRSYVKELALWGKPDHDVSLWKVFLRPFILYSYPTVIWACIVYGASLGWNVILGATIAQLFAPQYGFDAQSQGLVFISPFIGSLVGTWLCGPLADRIATYYTIKNNGIREPEMRLPACAIAAVLVFFGTLVASLTYQYNTHWMGPVVGFGILSAGAQMGATLSMSYVLDCHAEVSW